MKALVLSCFVFTPILNSCVQRAETPIAHPVNISSDGKVRREVTPEETKGLSERNEDYWGYRDRQYCQQRGECKSRGE